MFFAKPKVIDFLDAVSRFCIFLKLADVTLEADFGLVSFFIVHAMGMSVDFKGL